MGAIDWEIWSLAGEESGSAGVKVVLLLVFGYGGWWVSDNGWWGSMDRKANRMNG